MRTFLIYIPDCAIIKPRSIMDQKKEGDIVGLDNSRLSEFKETRAAGNVI